MHKGGHLYHVEVNRLDIHAGCECGELRRTGRLIREVYNDAAGPIAFNKFRNRSKGLDEAQRESPGNYIKAERLLEKIS